MIVFLPPIVYHNWVTGVKTKVIQLIVETRIQITELTTNITDEVLNAFKMR